MEIDNKDDDFITTKILTDAVQWHKDKEPDLIIQFRNKLNNYIKLLNKTHNNRNTKTLQKL